MQTRLDQFNTVLYAIGCRLDGDLIETASSILAPVKLWFGPSFPFEEEPFVAIRKISDASLPATSLLLKCAFGNEERQGLRAQMMWEGPLAHIFYLSEVSLSDGTEMTVATMERGTELLSNPYSHEQILELCAAAALAHDIPPANRADYTVLSDRFRTLYFSDPDQVSELLGIQSLFPMADSVRADLKEFFSKPYDTVKLHGDIHHGNLMRFERNDGYNNLLIDPKALLGESLYDYANMFLNPNICDPRVLDLFDERVEIVAQFLHGRYGEDLTDRLLRWIRAHACLSAFWHTEDLNYGAARDAFGIAWKAQNRLSALANRA